jgi:signal transduction histidine kinase
MLETEIVKLKAALRKKDVLLRTKEKELKSYYFAISHELKTPLSAMKGYLSLLEEFHIPQLNSEAVQYIDRLGKNVTRMQHLINDLMEFSKIELLETDCQTVLFDTILNEALLELQYSIHYNKVKIIQALQYPEIFCHSQFLGRALINLITNAIKYSRTNANPEIEVGYAEDELFHKFFVRDNGIGISKQEQAQLFRMFGRLKRKEGVEGTGLGLVITKRIIESHGGEIWIQSRKNHGATFYFTLPKY